MRSSAFNLRLSENSQIGGLTARHVTAWGEAPGYRPQQTPLRPERAGHRWRVIYFGISGLDGVMERITWAFSPGYHMAGLQPFRASSTIFDYASLNAVR